MRVKSQENQEGNLDIFFHLTLLNTVTSIPIQIVLDDISLQSPG